MIALPPLVRRSLAELRALVLLAALVLAVQSVVGRFFYIPSASMMPTLLVGDRLAVSAFPYGWSYASPVFHLLPVGIGRWWGRMPARGDVVVFTPPGGARREDVIKRVIGLPGDQVRMVAGRLWLNGRPVPASILPSRLLPVDGNLRCDGSDTRPDASGATSALVVRDGARFCRVRVVRETLPGGRSYETLDLGPSDEDDTPPVVVPAGQVYLLGDNRDNSADSRVPVAFGGLGGPIPWAAIVGRAEAITFSLSGDATLDPRTWRHTVRVDRAFRSLRPARERLAG